MAEHCLLAMIPFIKILQVVFLIIIMQHMEVPLVYNIVRLINTHQIVYFQITVQNKVAEHCFFMTIPPI